VVVVTVVVGERHEKIVLMIYLRMVMGVMVVENDFSMFWFPAPSSPSQDVLDALEAERRYLMGPWPWWKVGGECRGADGDVRARLGITVAYDGVVHLLEIRVLLVLTIACYGGDFRLVYRSWYL
jgi:hypothetical protein